MKQMSLLDLWLAFSGVLLVAAWMVLFVIALVRWDQPPAGLGVPVALAAATLLVGALLAVAAVLAAIVVAKR